MLEGESIRLEAAHVRRIAICAFVVTEKLEGSMRLHAPIGY